jgi:hypothetical protein
MQSAIISRAISLSGLHISRRRKASSGLQSSGGSALPGKK